MKTLDKLREQVECLYLGKEIERFSYDLEMKTREQNRNRWSFFTFIYNRSSKWIILYILHIKTETTNERKYSDLIGLSNGYKRAWLLVD